ncbi:MAG: hypothetical protein K6G36_01460 [Candidatus Saccharibacteria bacterium]|nr:hypothetical protein [Candidatus Saccharibacteria bacterium]
MKKLIGILLSAMFALTPTTVLAAQSDLRFNGDYEFKAEGEYNSSAFFAGNEVEDGAVVHGIDFAFGDKVENKGSYEYGFHAGNKLVTSGNYEKDLFAFGNEIVVAKEAKIARDFYAAGSKIEINSNIPGSVFATASKIVLNNVTVGGDLRVAAAEVEIIGDVKIGGTFVYNEDLNVVGKDTMVAGEIETYRPILLSFRWNNNLKIIFAVLCLASSIVIAVVFILIARRFFNGLKEKAEAADTKYVLVNLGVGLLGVIIIPLIVALLTVTVVGIPAALLLLFAFIIAIVLSATVFAAFIGGKIMPKQSTILSSTIVLILMAVVGYIPVVGWMINSVCTLIGFGIILTSIFDKKVAQKTKVEEPKEEE